MAIVSFLFFSSGAIADPSPEVKALFNEPASMFDLGMLKAQDHLNQHIDNFRISTKKHIPTLGEIIVDVRYDWDGNRFSFYVRAFGDNPWDLPTKDTIERLMCFFYTWVGNGLGLVEGGVEDYQPCSEGIESVKTRGPKMKIIFAILVEEWFSHKAYTSPTMKAIEWEKVADRFWVNFFWGHKPMASGKIDLNDISFTPEYGKLK